MRFRRVRTALTVLALLGSLVAATPLRAQEGVEFFPLDQVKPGLKGVGRTVFEGNKVTEFQVEILGVLKNAIAPKQDLILARLAGGPLASTGVIAGMSGSPVYIDGKLVGAVAVAFAFAKEPVAGITPISEMMAMVPEAPARHAVSASTGFGLVRGPGGLERLIPTGTFDAAAWLKQLSPPTAPGSMVNASLPLHFGGFPSTVVDAVAPLFRQLGFEPMAGGVLTGSSAPATAEEIRQSAQELAPGMMVSMFLVGGDLNLNADCTVTLRQGDKLYACGHHLLQVGPAEIPFAPAHVLASVASLSSSFKLDEPGPPVGAIQQDRSTAVYGVVGDKADVIPVHVALSSGLSKKTDYNFDIVQEPFLSPLLLNLTVVSALTATERTVGPSTLDVKGTIELSGGETVSLGDVFSSDLNTANVVGAAMAQPLTYILASGFPNLRVKSIELTVAAQEETHDANLEEVWSSKAEVHPGDHIEVTALLRTPSGESIIQKIPVDIPESVTDKMLSLVVGSGAGLNALQFRLSPLAGAPRDLGQLVRALNKMRRNNRLYALLMTPQRSFMLEGDEYPSPPPSLLQTLMADPAASSSVTYNWMSVVGDFETKPTAYVIHGQKVLFLHVERAGS